MDFECGKISSYLRKNSGYTYYIVPSGEHEKKASQMISLRKMRKSTIR